MQTSSRREVITGSTHPRQVTDRLSKDRTRLGYSRISFGCPRKQFEIVGSQIAKRLVKIMNSEFKGNAQVAAEVQERKKLFGDDRQTDLVKLNRLGPETVA